MYFVKNGTTTIATEFVPVNNREQVVVVYNFDAGDTFTVNVDTPAGNYVVDALEIVIALIAPLP